MIRKKINRVLNSKWFYIILVLFTFCYVWINVTREKEGYFSLDDETFEGVLIDLKIVEGKIVYTIEGVEKLNCNYYLDENDNVVEVRKKYRLGSKLRIKGSLGEPQNNTVPNTFNYKKYLYNHGIVHTCTAETIDIIGENMNLLYGIKNFIVDRIMSFEMKDYMFTLLLGDKSLLDAETFEDYRKNGVTHLFAISGMHIGLFSGAILVFLEKMHFKKNKRYIITVLFVWLYAFLTGFSPSVLRACVLFSLLSLCKIYALEVETLNVLIVSGCILLFYDSFLILDIGFIYSFTTTFGLLYSSKVITKHKILGTSLVATLFSLPITIQNFFKVNLLSAFFNIIFVPLVSVIIYPLCLLSFVFRFLSPFTKMSIFFLEMLNSLLAKVDFLYIVVPKMSLWLVIIYYAILMLGIKKKFYKTCILLVCIVLLNKIGPLLDVNCYIDFLDVGQGDSAIIRSPRSKKIVLIDTGGKESFGSFTSKYHVSANTITYLNSLGIDKIDHMILTHGDYDHMGEAIYLIENMKIGEVIFNCGEFKELELTVIKALEEKKIPYSSCIKEINIDDGKLHFLNNKDYGNENDNSSVIYTELYDHKFLFMGDAGVKVEEDLIKEYNLNDIDVLKVGHHGSKTSSSKKFIDEVNSKYSIISVGKNNRYGHPNVEVLDVLKNSKIYRTDLDGSVKIELDRNGIKLEFKHIKDKK